MTLAELKKLIVIYENKTAEIKEACELLSSIDPAPWGDEPRSKIMVVMLNVWMECPPDMAVIMARSHVQKLKDEQTALGKKIGLGGDDDA